MIVEVRTYRTKPGMREHFLEFFRERAIPLQQSLGIRVIGPFIDNEDSDGVIWARAFPSLAERDRMKAELYEGEAWTTELEAVVMPMLERYYSTQCNVPEWFVNDFPSSARS